jgi:hypothetical protein
MPRFSGTMADNSLHYCRACEAPMTAPACAVCGLIDLSLIILMEKQTQCEHWLTNAKILTEAEWREYERTRQGNGGELE